MREEKLDLQPQTLGERWFAFAVENSKSKLHVLVPIAFGLAFLAFYLASANRFETVDMWLALGLCWFTYALVYFERHIAYRLLKRQQDEIERLKKACSTNEVT